MFLGTRTVLMLGFAILFTAPLHAQKRSDLLSGEEIERMTGKGSTAYAAVETLRPRWLTKREVYLNSGEVNTEGPHVYLDDHDMGDVEFLKTIPTEMVAEIRYLSANQAASRYGPTSSPGIVVTLKH